MLERFNKRMLFNLKIDPIIPGFKIGKGHNGHYISNTAENPLIIYNNQADELWKLERGLKWSSGIYSSYAYIKAREEKLENPGPCQSQYQEVKNDTWQFAQDLGYNGGAVYFTKTELARLNTIEHSYIPEKYQKYFIRIDSLKILGKYDNQDITITGKILIIPNKQSIVITIILMLIILAIIFGISYGLIKIITKCQMINFRNK